MVFPSRSVKKIFIIIGHTYYFQPISFAGDKQSPRGFPSSASYNESFIIIVYVERKNAIRLSVFARIFYTRVLSIELATHSVCKSSKLILCGFGIKIISYLVRADIYFTLLYIYGSFTCERLTRDGNGTRCRYKNFNKPFYSIYCHKFHQKLLLFTLFFQSNKQFTISGKNFLLSVILKRTVKLIIFYG